MSLSASRARWPAICGGSAALLLGLAICCIGPLDASAGQPPEVDLLEDVVDQDIRGLTPGSESHGTGFHIDDRGHVLTAAHVVAGCRSVMVSAADAAASRARLLGMDARRDVALLRVADRPGHWFEIARDDPVTDHLVVFSGAGGNPGVRRFLMARLGPPFRSGPFELRSFRPVLESGASGGPVLDGRGLVVGMSVGTISEAGEFTLAVGGRDVGEFLTYMRVAPPRRARLTERAGGRIDGPGIAHLQSAIVRIDCA